MRPSIDSVWDKISKPVPAVKTPAIDSGSGAEVPVTIVSRICSSRSSTASFLIQTTAARPVTVGRKVEALTTGPSVDSRTSVGHCVRVQRTRTLRDAPSYVKEKLPSLGFENLRTVGMLVSRRSGVWWDAAKERR